MRLWSGDEKPWPEDAPGGTYYRATQKYLSIDVGRGAIDLTFGEECLRLDPSDKAMPSSMVSIGAQWGWNFGLEKTYYDGCWYTLFIGPFFVSWFV